MGPTPPSFAANASLNSAKVARTCDMGIVIASYYAACCVPVTNLVEGESFSKGKHSLRVTVRLAGGSNGADAKCLWSECIAELTRKVFILVRRWLYSVVVIVVEALQAQNIHVSVGTASDRERTRPLVCSTLALLSEL